MCRVGVSSSQKNCPLFSLSLKHSFVWFRSFSGNSTRLNVYCWVGYCLLVCALRDRILPLTDYLLFGQRVGKAKTKIQKRKQNKKLENLGIGHCECATTPYEARWWSSSFSSIIIILCREMRSCFRVAYSNVNRSANAKKKRSGHQYAVIRHSIVVLLSFLFLAKKKVPFVWMASNLNIRIGSSLMTN